MDSIGAAHEHEWERDENREPYGYADGQVNHPICCPCGAVGDRIVRRGGAPEIVVHGIEVRS